MSEKTETSLQREFRCDHCNGLIRVPIDLPPTTAPCPHCGEETTSPGPDDISPETDSPAAAGQTIEFPSAPGDQTEVKPKDLDDLPLEEKDPEPTTKKTPFLRAAIAMLCVVLVGAGIIAFVLVRDKQQSGASAANKGASDLEQENHYIRTGWKREAFEVLEKFITAKTIEEKLACVLRPEEVEAKMREFYGDGPIDDMDTPAEAFSIFVLPERDRRNGMYMLVYDQPAQLKMRNFFRPVASLEVQYGLEEADPLLNSMALFSNFSMDPVRVHALFKMTDKGLKLDWEIFIQTKHRKLKNFLDAQELGQTEVFRVFIREDVPKRGVISPDSRTYRVSDPAYASDSARVEVLLDTKVANELAILNWVGVQGAREYFRTATVELEWRPGDYEPYLLMKRFVCWEYLGMGGKEIPGSAEAEDSPGIPSPGNE